VQKIKQFVKDNEVELVSGFIVAVSITVGVAIGNGIGFKKGLNRGFKIGWNQAHEKIHPVMDLLGRMPMDKPFHVMTTQTHIGVAATLEELLEDMASIPQ
jgi:hypothetical protein